MPLFIDIHEELPDGATAVDVAHAHQADLAKQDEFGVKYIKYWVDEKDHKAFCLVVGYADTHRDAKGFGNDRAYPGVAETRYDPKEGAQYQACNSQIRSSYGK